MGTMLVMTTIFISKMEGLPPTSNIKMIDIWLVLCQMVPFAEVMLLTAMEYNREDERKKKKRGKKKKKGNKSKNLTIIPLTGTLVNESMGFDENRKGRLLFNCRLPSLKAIETNVLPSAVLASYIVYFAFALKFYFDY